MVPVVQLGFRSTLVHEIIAAPDSEGRTLGTSLFMSTAASFLGIFGVIAFTAIANPNDPETMLVCALYSISLVFQATEMLQYWFQAKLLSKYTAVASLAAYVIVSAYRCFLLITQKSVYWFAFSQALDYLLISVSLYGMLLLFPCVMRRCEGDVSFYRITIFFACGIITAALTAQQIATFPNISQFIKVDSYLTVTRLSGFYGDPNFYSAHIAACLAGTQLLLCHEKSRRRQIVLAILALVLLYCGLLSASKSFVIVTACLFLLWVPILLEKGTSSSRFRLFVGLLCAGIIIASSSAFHALLQIVDDRFAQASNMSELTTGRTDLWRNYIHEFLNNPITLLFGEGYTSINLNNKASHNTLIQVVYQFGLIGMPLLISWVVISLRNLFTQLNAGHVKWKHALLMCVGVALPWMGIDILQFDEFFLLPVYAVIGIAYSTRSMENKKLESSKGEI